VAAVFRTAACLARRNAHLFVLGAVLRVLSLALLLLLLLVFCSSFALAFGLLVVDLIDVRMDVRKRNQWTLLLTVIIWRQKGPSAASSSPYLVVDEVV
jgi:uncharacterized metal-binding protein